MVFPKTITINCADGATLEYSSTMRYTDGFVWGSKIKDFIREKTGKNNFDLYDAEGINQTDFEMVHALVLTCVFKPDECDGCGLVALRLNSESLCVECWRQKHTKFVDTEKEVRIKKTFSLDDDSGMCYKVYFNSDGSQDYIKIQYDDDRHADTIIRDDRLFRDKYSLVLESNIPDDFLEFYDEVQADGEPTYY